MSVIEFHIWPEDNPVGEANKLGVITDEDVVEDEGTAAIWYEPSLHGLGGTAGFSISRHSPLATSTIIREDNFVRVKVPEISAGYLKFGWWMKSGQFHLIDSDEAGGENITIEGPGLLHKLATGSLYHSSTVDDQPARGSADRDGLWWWIDEPYGAMLTRAFEEGRHSPYPDAAAVGSPLEFFDITFSRTVDSASVAWPNIDGEFQVDIGTDLMTLTDRLRESGNLYIVGDASDVDTLTVHCFQTYGEDLSGDFDTDTVRFERTVNIATELVRTSEAALRINKLLLRNSDGDYSTETLPGFSAGDVERWGYWDADQTNDDTLLNAIGLNVLLASQTSVEPVGFEALPGKEPTEGLYLPELHYKCGDTVTVHTGTDAEDYNEANQLVVAYRVSIREGSTDDTNVRAQRSLKIEPQLNYYSPRYGNSNVGTGPMGVAGCPCLRLCNALIPGTETITRLYFHPDAGDVEPAADDGWDTGTSDVHSLSLTPDADYSSTHSATSSAGGGVGTGTNVLYWAGVYEMPSGMAAIIAAGGATVRAQIRSRARFGIGISESSQDMISQIYLGVTTGASATIRGTALELHGLTSSTGASKWPANATKINKQFPPTGAGNVLSSVSGTATGDYLVVEVGNRNYTPSTTGGAIALTNDQATDLPEDDSSSDAINSWLEIRAISPPIGTGLHPDLVGTDHNASRCDHKHHILATRDPNSSDDITQGYPTTTLWTNTDSNQSFVLLDEDTGEWVPFATPGVGEHAHTAAEITYDPTTSGLTSDTVQEAIDELVDTVGEGVFLEKSDGENHTVNVVAATGSTETIDLSSGNYQDFTLDDDCTFTMPSPAAGKTFTAFVRQDGTGGWTPTFTDVEWPADTPPEWSTDPDTVDIVEFISDASVWYGFSGIDDTGGSLTDHNHTTAGGDGGDLDGALIGDFLEFTEASAPSTPATGFARVYAKSDGRIYSMDEGGTEYGPFDAAGGGGGGCTAPTGFPDIGTTANTQVSTNSTSHVVNLPSGITAGKLLLIVGGMDGAPTASATGWTSIATDDGGGVVSVVALYKFASGGEGATVTVTLTASEKAEWWSAIIDDAHASTPPEGAAAGLGSAQGLMKPPSVTPSWGADDTLWIGVAVGDLSAAANLRIAGQPIEHVFVWYHSLAATDGVHMALALRWLNTATHDTPPFYTSDVSYGNGSEQWATATVAVRPV